MKFGIAYANAGPFGFPEPLAHLARTAEETGFESIWTVEHVVIPVGYRARFPYHPARRLPGREDVARGHAGGEPRVRGGSRALPQHASGHALARLRAAAGGND